MRREPQVHRPHGCGLAHRLLVVPGLQLLHGPQPGARRGQGTGDPAVARVHRVHAGRAEVLAYAEAMSQTPPTVTDEMVANLLEQLGPAGLIELSTVIGFANLTTRSNVALGIESEGFATACGLKPMAERAEVASPA